MWNQGPGSRLTLGMAKLDTPVISKILRELAQRSVLAGGNPYRARAYSRAAENLALGPVPLEQLIAEGRLKEIPGIGDALSALITDVHRTGEHPRPAAMRKEVPEGVLEMLRRAKQRKVLQGLAMSRQPQGLHIHRASASRGFPPTWSASCAGERARHRERQGPRDAGLLGVD